MTSNGEHEQRRALILYGSETGNAQDVAEELGRMTERLRFGTCVDYLDAVEPSLLRKFSIVIIAISTAGQGDLPNNANVFWKQLLRKKLPPTFLGDVRFAAFGLGDSSYPKYNWAAKKLHRRLVQLGAKELVARGEADEQHPEGLDATFLPWINELRNQISVNFPLENGVGTIPEDVLLEPPWVLAIDARSNGSINGNLRNGYEGSEHGRVEDDNQNHDMYTESDHVSSSVEAALLTSGRKGLLQVKVSENTRITPIDHWQDVRQLTLEAETSVSYTAGDTLTIYPENPFEDVDQLLSLMEWKGIADEPIHFKRPQNYTGIDVKPPLSRMHSSGQLTLRRLLTKHLDLNAIPRRSFFANIVHFTQDAFQKDRLIEFTDPEYLDELHDYTTRPRRSVLEVLQEFDTVKIPWQKAASVLPELRGRQFSISSGGRLKTTMNGATSFSLLVAIVKYKTVIRKIREGVCTRYLANLPVDTAFQVTFQKGGLGITKAEARRPVVLVGPGTGVAPMRSLIWERLQWAEELTKKNTSLSNGMINGSSTAGESILFFGNRNRTADYFYEAEWEILQGRMPLRIFTAFSRDQRQKIYVQDLIKENSKLVYDALHTRNGIIYVCGSSGKMPTAVREALIEVFEKVAIVSRQDAETYLTRLEREGRYKQETW